MKVKRENISKKIEAKVDEYNRYYGRDRSLLILIDPFSFDALLYSNSAVETTESYNVRQSTFMGMNIQLIETCEEFITVQNFFQEDIKNSAWDQLKQRQKAETEMINNGLFSVDEW